MKTDRKKLENASIDDVKRELSLVENEIESVMQPISYARYKDLTEHQKNLRAELNRRENKE